MTGTGTFLGTVDCISPEQIPGKPADGRADQYALACPAFELLTRQPPFRRDEAAAVVYAQLSGPPPAVTAQRPGLPPDTDRVVAKAIGHGARGPLPHLLGVRRCTALGLLPYASGPGESRSRCTRRPRSWAPSPKTPRSPRRCHLPGAIPPEQAFPPAQTVAERPAERAARAALS